MKMNLKMKQANFEIEFDNIEEAYNFIMSFIEHNPDTSAINLTKKPKKVLEKENKINDN